MSKQSLVSVEAPGTALAEYGRPVDMLKSSESTNYVTFMNQKSQKFGHVMQSVPDLQNDDPILFQPDPAKPLKLSPFRFSLLRCTQYWAEVDQEGNTLRATFNGDLVDAKLKEHISTLLVVYTSSQLYLARCMFKTTKCKAAHQANEALKLAGTEDWGKQSLEHKATMTVPHPWARFTATVLLKPGVSRSTGFKFVAASSRIVPTGLAEWKQLTDFWADPANGEVAKGLDAAYEKWLNDLRSKEIK